MGSDPEARGRTSSNGSESSGLSRRRFMALQAAVVAGAGAGSVASAAPTDGDGTDASVGNTVSVDPDDRTEEAVSDGLFGRLSEHYESGTIYPGVYSEHVKNPTFYPRSWSEDDYFGPRTFYPGSEIERADGIPFPWEPVGGDGVTFEQRSGGVAAIDTTDYQRVAVDGARGGISQKIVLPDFRTHGYDLSVSVRGDGPDTVRAALTTLDGEQLAATDLDVTDEWTRHEVHLELDAASGDQYVAGGTNVDTPYGQYVLEFAAEGEGHVDVDWVNLAADDAVRGKFNPSTVELMREQDTTWLKWPGGNFTSQYNWRDGVGPKSERPVRFNHAWGGINPNYFGTAEYLELCEVADLTPRLTIGWWDNPPEWASERQILPEDAADWVEYVNGSTDTEMGALRAEHGYEEPWDVTHWEVGNEVWGPWQRGSTQNPSEYASGSDARIGFTTYYDEMTAVDDDITVYADAMDPGYDESNTPDPDAWNGTLFEEAGDRLDGVDLHRYNWGIENQADRDAWYQRNGADAIDYNEVLVMFPTEFDRLMENLADRAADAGIEDFRVNVGEYGLFPTVDSGAPYPGPETMPGGSYIAGMLNAFIRRSDTVKEASQTWWPVRMFPPADEEAPPDPNPLAPAGTVTALYGAVFDGHSEWHAVDVGIDGDSRTIPETGPRIDRMEDVPYVDAAGMVDRRGQELAVFLTNRNLSESAETTVEVGEKYAGSSVEVVAVVPTADERPLPHDFITSWSTPDNYVAETTVETVGDDGTLSLALPPAAVVRCYVDNDRGQPDRVGDNGVWHGIEVAPDGEPYHEDFCGGGHERGGPGNGKGNGRGNGNGNGNNGNGNGNNGNGNGNNGNGDDESGEEGDGD
ncbi:alpha-L-arabinofuranosidase [Halosimplex pelagicum]|uniref:alpha-L-arabinofuranosidase n=1 Tax=Halosimplex pelagicum TaxID=869886 RepID=UPI001C54DA16|nr:alpha-L-arabinofuranosidase [Halosimplex pelagicum]